MLINVPKHTVTLTDLQFVWYDVGHVNIQFVCPIAPNKSCISATLDQLRHKLGEKIIISDDSEHLDNDSWSVPITTELSFEELGEFGIPVLNES